MEFNIVDTIMLLNEQCCHLNDTGINENNLTAKELHVLLSLKPGESVTSIDLAKRNSLSPSRMSRIIDNLSASGLLNRVTDDRDRRYHRVSLTNEGILINRHTFEFKRSCESKIKAKLSDREFAIIQRALQLLLFAMENEYEKNITETIAHH
jgi:DNA-binding MarR family transcriptional regulator